MTLVIQDIYLKNITFLWDVSVFFRFFHPEFGAKRVRSDAPGQATALPVIVWVKNGRALDWSSPAGPKSDAQGGLPLGYGSKMIVISFGIIGKYQLISTDIN